MEDSTVESNVATGELLGVNDMAETANGKMNLSRLLEETKTEYPVSSSKRCAVCGKEEEDEDHLLKECSKCHSTKYCSRECQKADFKQHKKSCASLAQVHAQSGAQKPVQSAPRVPKQAHRGGLQKWQFDT